MTNTNKNNHSIIKFVAFIVLISSILIVTFVIIKEYQRNSLIDRQIKQRDQAMGISRQEITEQQKEDYKVDQLDQPRLIMIPKLNIKARIEPVGLMEPNKHGQQQLGSPKNINDIGWYNCQINPLADKRCIKYIGPLDNDIDQAVVMDGHSCNQRGCVLDYLEKLMVGDLIKVELGDGRTINYLVNKVERLPLEAVDMTKVMQNYQQGQPGLNIITCIGSWNKTDSRGVLTMNDRLVLYSTRQAN